MHVTRVNNMHTHHMAQMSACARHPIIMPSMMSGWAFASSFWLSPCVSPSPTFFSSHFYLYSDMDSFFHVDNAKANNPCASANRESCYLAEYTPPTQDEDFSIKKEKNCAQMLERGQSVHHYCNVIQIVRLVFYKTMDPTLHYKMKTDEIYDGSGERLQPRYVYTENTRSRLGDTETEAETERETDSCQRSSWTSRRMHKLSEYEERWKS